MSENGKVKVKLVFLGNVRESVGIDSTDVEISPNIMEAFGEIRYIVKDIAGKELLYNALINGQNHALAAAQGKQLADGDEITLMQCILGG